MEYAGPCTCTSQMRRKAQTACSFSTGPKVTEWVLAGCCGQHLRPVGDSFQEGCAGIFRITVVCNVQRHGRRTGEGVLEGRNACSGCSGHGQDRCHLQRLPGHFCGTVLHSIFATAMLNELDMCCIKSHMLVIQGPQ